MQRIWYKMIQQSKKYRYFTVNIDALIRRMKLMQTPLQHSWLYYIKHDTNTPEYELFNKIVVPCIENQANYAVSTNMYVNCCKITLYLFELI